MAQNFGQPFQVAPAPTTGYKDPLLGNPAADLVNRFQQNFQDTGRMYGYGGAGQAPSVPVGVPSTSPNLGEFGSPQWQGSNLANYNQQIPQSFRDALNQARMGLPTANIGMSMTDAQRQAYQQYFANALNRGIQYPAAGMRYAQPRVNAYQRPQSPFNGQSFLDYLRQAMLGR